MTALDLISKNIPPLKTSDTGERAMNWMSEFRISHLPIVNHSQFLGLISEEDILNLDDLSTPLGGYQLSLQKPFVLSNSHVYEALKVAMELQLSLLPVIDMNDNYEGVITHAELLQGLNAIISAGESGSIIVLEVNSRNYALNDLARIVEAEGVKILSVNIKSQPTTNILEVTLKLNSSKINNVLSTLERFNYNIKASFLESDYSDTLKERYNGLINYLNV